MAVTNAEDLAKLLSTAADSAASAANDAAEAERAVGALKQLQKRAVTAALLKETDAGKRVNKLSKHALPAISAAAAAVVQAWKECVKQEQGARGSGGGVGGGNGGDGVRSAGGGGASSSGSGMARTGSVASASDAPATAAGRATTTSSGGGAEPAAAPARAPAKATGASAVPPKSGNPKRDKARAMVFDGLSLSLSEGAVPAAPLGPLAAEVEDALWAANCEGCREPTPAYLAKVRTVVFNLKDAGNPDLRRRVAAGHIPPEALAQMSAEDMASDKRKADNAQIRKEMAAELVRGQQQQATTDQFQCGKCKQRKVTYYHMHQLRSSVEVLLTSAKAP